MDRHAQRRERNGENDGGGNVRDAAVGAYDERGDDDENVPGDAFATLTFLFLLVVFATLLIFGLVTQLHTASLRSGELVRDSGEPIALSATSPATVVLAGSSAIPTAAQSSDRGSGKDTRVPSAGILSQLRQVSVGLGSALGLGSFPTAKTYYVRASAVVSAATQRTVIRPSSSRSSSRSSSSIPASRMLPNSSKSKLKSTSTSTSKSKSSSSSSGQGHAGAGTGRGGSTLRPEQVSPSATVEVAAAADAVDATDSVPQVFVRLADEVTGEPVLQFAVGAAVDPDLWLNNLDASGDVRTGTEEVFLIGGPAYTAGTSVGTGEDDECGYIAPAEADSDAFPLRAGNNYLWVAFVAAVDTGGGSGGSGVSCWAGLPRAGDAVLATPSSRNSSDLSPGNRTAIHLGAAGVPVPLNATRGDAVRVQLFTGVSRSLRGVSGPEAQWVFWATVIFAILLMAFLSMRALLSGCTSRGVGVALLAAILIVLASLHAATGSLPSSDGATVVLILLFLASLVPIGPVSVFFVRGRTHHMRLSAQAMLREARLRREEHLPAPGAHGRRENRRRGGHGRGRGRAGRWSDESDEGGYGGGARGDVMEHGVLTRVVKYVMSGASLSSAVGIGSDASGGFADDDAGGEGEPARRRAGRGRGARGAGAGAGAGAGNPVGRPPLGPGAAPGSARRSASGHHLQQPHNPYGSGAAAAGGRYPSPAAGSNDAASAAAMPYRSIALLPAANDPDEAHRLFCPICMMYFDRLYSTSCCRQHVCDDCAREYCESRGELGPGHMPLAVSLPESVPCLHCRAIGFALMPVLDVEAGFRKYDDSPVARRPPPRASRFHSPLKIGDSYEAMRRKMISLEDATRPAQQWSPSVAGSSVAEPVMPSRTPARGGGVHGAPSSVHTPASSRYLPMQRGTPHSSVVATPRSAYGYPAGASPAHHGGNGGLPGGVAVGATPPHARHAGHEDGGLGRGAPSPGVGPRGAFLASPPPSHRMGPQGSVELPPVRFGSPVAVRGAAARADVESMHEMEDARVAHDDNVGDDGRRALGFRRHNP